jgi:hypothetical protein
MKRANDAIDEVRRAEFFRKSGRIRGVVKGQRWLLLSRWVNLTPGKRQELNQLFCSQPEGVSAPLAASGALPEIGGDAAGPPGRQSELLLQGSSGGSGSREWEHQDTTTSRAGYKNLRYLLLKAQRMAATRTEFVVFRKAA